MDGHRQRYDLEVGEVTAASKLLDNALVVVILGWYIAGSGLLVLKALVSRPADRKRVFSHGELGLLPQSWQRWMLGDKPARR